MRAWLNNLRKNSQLTQKEIEKICGVSQSCFSRYENGVRTPHPITAKKIATLLNFDWTKFYEEDDCEKTDVLYEDEI